MRQRIPEPDFDGDTATFYPLVRIGPQIPFGYEKDPEDPQLLHPVPNELILLEQAKQHLKNGFSLREVSAWLSGQTGRKISHQGLKDRISADQKRDKEYIVARKMARQFKEAYIKAKRIEARRLGGVEPGTYDIEKELFDHVRKGS